MEATALCFAAERCSGSASIIIIRLQIEYESVCVLPGVHGARGGVAEGVDGPGGKDSGNSE